MSVNARRILNAIRDADHELNDPGPGGHIDPFGDLQICELVTTSAESRTLADPTKAGIRFTLRLKTDGGDCTVTAANGFDVDGNTEAVFADAGDLLEMISVSRAEGYRWEVISGSAALTGGVTPTPASAFDDIWGWWRADTYTGTSPTIALTDLSGNSRTMTQQAGTLTAGTSANGQAKLTGNASTYLTSAATLKNWPVTIVTYGQRTAGTSQGHFGHVGGTGFNTLWCGYESLDRFCIINTNAILNTSAVTDGCWVARVGHGSRHTITNGVSLSDNALASVVQSSAIATSIGTQYRGMNFPWQETLVWDRLLSIEELDEVYTYLNERYSASIPLSISRTAVPLIVILGDSNAAGRGDRGTSDVNIPAEYLGPITNANVWYGGASNLGMGTAYETLDNTKSYGTWVGNHMFGDNYSRPTAYVGCESSLMKEYIDANGGSAYLLKSGIGGSYLYPTGSFWHPTAGGLTQFHTSRCFGQFSMNWWKSMYALNAAGYTPDLKGIVIMLGGNDASDVTGTAAAAFEANLPVFYAALRAEIGIPNAKLFQCRWHSGSVEPYTATIRAATDAVVAATSNCTLVDMDSYPLRGSGDTGHYSIVGQTQIGQYLAGVM